MPKHTHARSGDISLLERLLTNGSSGPECTTRVTRFAIWPLILSRSTTRILGEVDVCE